MLISKSVSGGTCSAIAPCVASGKVKVDKVLVKLLMTAEPPKKIL